MTSDGRVLDLGMDMHAHSTFSDDATSTLAENLAAARATGLHTVRCVDHVRSSTTWVPEFLAAVSALPQTEGLAVVSGVETKLLNVAGELDLPAGTETSVAGNGGPDAIVVGDHQFPGMVGPVSPREMTQRLADGMSVDDALDQYIGASVAAMARHDGLQLAHWFSILPKVGLSEDSLTSEHLEAWAVAAAASGTVIEVNEKWQCPGPRALRHAMAHGVTLVASSDSHEAGSVGRYAWVRSVASELEDPRGR